MSEEQLKSKNIKEENTKSPDFENEVDPIQLLELLDKFMLMLKENPSEETVAKIHKRLDYYEIVIADVDGTNLWITSPFTHTRFTQRRTLLHRISNFIETGGEWINEIKHRHGIYVPFPDGTAMPLQVNVSTEMQNIVVNDKVSGLLVTLNHIHETVINAAKQESGTIGVFETPYAVINMNNLKQWLNDMEPKAYWNNRYHLVTQSLADVVQEATFTVASEETKTTPETTTQNKEYTTN